MKPQPKFELSIFVKGNIRLRFVASMRALQVVSTRSSETCWIKTGDLRHSIKGDVRNIDSAAAQLG
jgi:hypothetical protein